MTRIVAKNCVDVSELVPPVLSKRVRVKILRCFESTTLFYETIELILADKWGGKIHAIIPRDVAERYSKVIKEGNCVVIARFKLEPNVQRIRLTDHLYTINWVYGTVMCKLRILDPSEHFDFAKFEDVKDGLLDANTCIDVIGRVMSVGNFDEGEVLDSNWEQIYLELENDKDERLQCRLPREYSTEFWAGWKDCVDNIIICILRFVRIEERKGDDRLGSLRVTTTYSCTKVIFNHSCSEDSELRNYFSVKDSGMSREVLRGPSNDTE